MYTIHREDSRHVQYTVEPEKGHTRQDIVQALQSGAAKLQDDKIILAHADSDGKVLMGTVKGEEANSNVSWS